MNRRTLYILIGLGILVILVLVVVYLSLSNNTVKNIVVNASTVQAKMKDNFDLSKDMVFFETGDAKLEYQHQKNTYALQLSKSLTTPVYQTVQIEGIERLAAEKLRLSPEELCFLPLQVVDANSTPYSLMVCSGEE